MTPKEFDFLCFLVERASAEAYARGVRDAGSKKSIKEDAFKLSKAHRMTIQTMLKKHVESR